MGRNRATPVLDTTPYFPQYDEAMDAATPEWVEKLISGYFQSLQLLYGDAMRHSLSVCYNEAPTQDEGRGLPSSSRIAVVKPGPTSGFPGYPA
ncbi:MAG: hypothetical protein JW846_03440 [Dehalococcoidia bacterium]|nr:hypothetical protein [Dehalococcoidia bacterium]